MKKLIISIIAVLSFIHAFSQGGNDTTNYVWYKHNYGNRVPRVWGDTVMMIPKDTIWSKDGIALKNGIFYTGNGIKWTALGSGGGPVDSFFVATRARLQKVTDSMVAVNNARYLKPTDTANLKYRIDTLAGQTFGLHIKSVGVTGDSMTIIVDDTTLKQRKIRDSSATGQYVKHTITPDSALVLYNLPVVGNAGASKSISAGTLGARPAASNCQCYYFSTTDSTWSYDNGGWIPVKGGSGGVSGPPSVRYTFNCPACGFTIGKTVSKTATTWVLADTINNIRTGYVSKAIDANTFELTTSGPMFWTSGLGLGAQAFQSTTAGATTTTSPVISIPTGVQIATDTFMVILGRPVDFSGSGASVLWPNERPIGTIYAPKYFTAADYTPSGSAATTSGGIISGGSSGVYTNFLTIGQPMNYQYWHFTQGVKVLTETASSGIEIGTHSANVPNPFDAGVNINLNTGGSNPIFCNSLGSNQLFSTSGTNLTYSINDSLQVDVDFALNVLTVSVKNITTAGATVSASKTWATPTVGGAGGFYPNTSYFSVYALGGTQLLSPPVITSSWTKNPTGLFLIDSRGEYSGTSWTSGPGDSLNINFPHALTWCDEGSGTTQFLAAQQSIFSLNPKTVYFFVGSNGKRAGLTDAQEEFNDDSLMTVLQQKGFRTFLCVIPEDSLKSGIGMTAIKNRDSAIYSAKGQYVDIWNPLTNGTNILASAYEYTDGIHWIAAGQSKVYRTILNSGTMMDATSRNNFLQQDGLFTKLQAGQIDLDTAQARKWIGSFSASAVTDINTSDASLTFSPTIGHVLGSVNTAHLFTWTSNHIFPNIATAGGTPTYHYSDATFQSTTANANLGGNLFTQAIGGDNHIIAVNSIFNGSVQKYVAGGFAYATQFNGGEFNYYNAASGSAGATISYNQRLKILNTGQFQFNAYGAGTFTGTATKNLAVDASGNVIETAPGGGSSPPFDANTAILMDHTDNTKTLKYDLSGLTTATARTITIPNTSYIDAGINIAQTWTGAQNMTGATVTVTTQSPLDNSTKAASTAYVDAAVALNLRGTIATIGDADYTVASGVEFVVYATTLTANRVITLPSASSNNGRHIRLWLQGGGGFQWNIASSSNIILFNTTAATSQVTNLANATFDILSDGTTWRTTGISHN